MTLAALAAMLWSLPAAAQEEYRQPALENPESWSVVVIPDLQGYAKNEASQPIARLMTAWIADNIERLNVRMVLCVGDVVEQNDRIGNGFSGDLTSVRQWQGMADAFDRAAQELAAVGLAERIQHYPAHSDIFRLKLDRKDV